MTFDEERYPKKTKLGLGLEYKSDLELVTEEPNLPQEKVAPVFMRQVKLLIPGTQEYDQYDGIETAALASCTGLAIYVPKGDRAIFGIAHLAPSQSIHSVIRDFYEQLRRSGLNPRELEQSEGFMELIPGQTTYENTKRSLREKVEEDTNTLKELFPLFRSFPNNHVAYSVLSSHSSLSVKLLKNGDLFISGEN